MFSKRQTKRQELQTHKIYNSSSASSTDIFNRSTFEMKFSVIFLLAFSSLTVPHTVTACVVCYFAQFVSIHPIWSWCHFLIFCLALLSLILIQHIQNFVSPCLDVDSSWTQLPDSDDGSSDAIDLPFGLKLYGYSYSSVYVNMNGNLSFNSSTSAFSSIYGFPMTEYVMVAPFWADVDTRPVNGGGVYYKVIDENTFAAWVNVCYYSNNTDLVNTFQVVITSNSPFSDSGTNVCFCYNGMDWTTGDASSGATRGFGGTPATVGANAGVSSIIVLQLLFHAETFQTNEMDLPSSSFGLG
jgi:hypothetical protein